MDNSGIYFLLGCGVVVVVLLGSLAVFFIRHWLQARRFKKAPTGALVRAARGGEADAVVKALTDGADINGVSPDGESALREAAGGGHISVVNLLLDRRALPSTAALAASARNGHGEVVKVLIRRGPCVKVGKADCNPLADAVSGGNTQIVEILLQNGAKVQDRMLYEPAKARNAGLIKLLVAAGADADRADSNHHYGPDYLKQQIIEALEGESGACELCQRIGEGSSRGFFACAVKSQTSTGGTGSIRYTTTQPIAERIFFICAVWLKARTEEIMAARTNKFASGIYSVPEKMFGDMRLHFDLDGEETPWRLADLPWEEAKRKAPSVALRQSFEELGERWLARVKVEARQEIKRVAPYADDVVLRSKTAFFRSRAITRRRS